MVSRYAICAALFLPLSTAAAPRYTVTALPQGTAVSAINEQGQVAGYVGTAQGPRGFVWSPAAFTSIPAPAGSFSFATAISDTGAVVGYTSVDDGQARFSYAFADASVTELDIFASPFSYAQAINASGAVVGAYARDGNLRAYLYGKGLAADLGTLGGSFAAANGINNRGQVVGFSSVDDSQLFSAHAFLYADGVMTDLGTLDEGSVSEATAINELGQITGSAWVQGSSHAFLYSGGIMRDLGTLGGRYSYGYDINNAGQIVGAANAPGDLGLFAFVHDGGTMLDLNTLIDASSGWVLSEARGINDRGQIAAFGCRGDECGGVLLEPALQGVPSPAPWQLLLAACALPAWRRISAACRYARCRLRHRAPKT